MKRHKKGQSILEYVIIITAIVAAIAIAANSVVGPAVSRLIGRAGAKIDSATLE